MALARVVAAKAAMPIGMLRLGKPLWLMVAGQWLQATDWQGRGWVINARIRRSNCYPHQLPAPEVFAVAQA